jgi:N6-L-threonylcarbamoyladenine synthase/protein kinase Bud32
MDLHVFGQSVEGTAETPEPLFDACLSGYLASGGTAAEDVVERLRTVEGRGRYQ